MDNSIKVIIVDDHPLFRQGLKDLLDSETDIQIIDEIENGEVALERIKELQPDVVLLDVNLPGMNGMQVCRQAKASREKAGFVMLTAYDDSEQILHAFRAGASAYCPKDVKPEKLTEIVRHVSKGHFVVDGQLFDNEGIQRWLHARVEQVDRPYIEDAQELFSPLSPREMEILRYVTRGMSNKEIALGLGISHQTVKKSYDCNPAQIGSGRSHTSCGLRFAAWLGTFAGDQAVRGTNGKRRITRTQRPRCTIP